MSCINNQELTSLSTEEIVEKYLIARKEIKTAIKFVSKLEKWFSLDLWQHPQIVLQDPRIPSDNKKTARHQKFKLSCVSELNNYDDLICLSLKTNIENESKFS